MGMKWCLKQKKSRLYERANILEEPFMISHLKYEENEKIFPRINISAVIITRNYNKKWLNGI